MSVEQRSKFAVLHPAMATSPYELKILEWDEKKTEETNKSATLTCRMKFTGMYTVSAAFFREVTSSWNSRWSVVLSCKLFCRLLW